MGTTDAVKDNVYALTGDALNFFHEIETSVINWDTAQVGPTPFVGTSAVHLEASEAPKLQ